MKKERKEERKGKKGRKSERRKEKRRKERKRKKKAIYFANNIQDIAVSQSIIPADIWM